MDLIIFSGQSNMQGQTESLPENLQVDGAVEYRFLTDSFVPLAHPVGGDINDGLLLGAHLGHGSLVPHFAESYVNETGRKIVAVHAARGSTRISQWQKNTADGEQRYKLLVEKTKGAKKKDVKIEKTFFVWLQGESDSANLTSYDDYKRMLIQLKNDLKNDVGIDKFLIISVGYFSFNYGGKNEWDEQIMKAQQDVCNEDTDFVMLTDVTKKLSLDKNYINPYETGHYNNNAMKVIGDLAGKNASKLR